LRVCTLAGRWAQHAVLLRTGDRCTRTVDAAKKEGH
jgi:hypothetical protein